MIMPRAEVRSRVEWTGETTKRSPSDPKKVGHPKELFAALNVGNYRNEAMRDVAFSDSLRQAREPLDHSRRSSSGDLNAVRHKIKDLSKRKSVAVMSDLEADDLDEFQRNNAAQNSSPKDIAKRHSKTFPLQINKLTSKRRPISAYGYAYTPEPESACDDLPESPMGLENEYTISYDLVDIRRDEYDRKPNRPNERPRESYEKPQWASGLRSRSLLNLHQLLKKDKDRTEVQTEKVNMVFDDIPENPPPRPLTAADGHHARQKSLPIKLGNDTMMRFKKEEREKKRRAFIGVFKKFS